jgi:hypothetical protein
MDVPVCRALLDDRRGSAADQEIPKGLAVVGRVGEQRLRWRQRLDQCRRRPDVVTVASGQFESDDPTISVNDRVDFRRASASALADGLRLGPPFPPAAQRWAFAVALSTH